MSLTVPQSRLSDAYDALLINWDHTKEKWRDDARRQFEKDFVDPASPAVKSALTAMSSISEHLVAARHACQ
ncbi:MAG: hypothetical protein AAGI30_03945 [Planctomycetota bacterium]